MLYGREVGTHNMITDMVVTETFNIISSVTIFSQATAHNRNSRHKSIILVVERAGGGKQYYRWLVA